MEALKQQVRNLEEVVKAKEKIITNYSASREEKEDNVTSQAKSSRSSSGCSARAKLTKLSSSVDHQKVVLEHKYNLKNKQSHL